VILVKIAKVVWGSAVGKGLTNGAHDSLREARVTILPGDRFSCLLVQLVAAYFSFECQNRAA
jgi:hypothetical protein